MKLVINCKNMFLSFFTHLYVALTTFAFTFPVKQIKIHFESEPLFSIQHQANMTELRTVKKKYMLKTNSNIRADGASKKT